MTRTEFEAGNDEYIRLYQSGFKKQANQLLQEHAALFAGDASAEQKDAVFTELLHVICDTDKGSMLTDRGNGRLPYALCGMLRAVLFAII